MKFYPTDGRAGVYVTSVQNIKDYMGDIVNSFDSIEIIGDLVVAYKNGLPVTLGHLENE